MENMNSIKLDNNYQEGLNDFYKKAFIINVDVKKTLKKELENKIEFVTKRLKEDKDARKRELLKDSLEAYVSELTKYNEPVSTAENKDNGLSFEEMVSMAINSQECTRVIKEEEKMEIYSAGYYRVKSTLEGLLTQDGLNCADYNKTLELLEDNNNKSILEILKKIRKHQKASGIPKEKRAHSYKELIYLTGEREYLASEARQYVNNKNEGRYRRS